MMNGAVEKGWSWWEVVVYCVWSGVLGRAEVAVILQQHAHEGSGMGRINNRIQMAMGGFIPYYLYLQRHRHYQCLTTSYFLRKFERKFNIRRSNIFLPKPTIVFLLILTTRNSTRASTCSATLAHTATSSSNNLSLVFGEVLQPTKKIFVVRWHSKHNLKHTNEETNIESSSSSGPSTGPPTGTVGWELLNCLAPGERFRPIQVNQFQRILLVVSSRLPPRRGRYKGRPSNRNFSVVRSKRVAPYITHRLQTAYPVFPTHRSPLLWHYPNSWSHTMNETCSYFLPCACWNSRWKPVLDLSCLCQNKPNRILIFAQMNPRPLLESRVIAGSYFIFVRKALLLKN